MDEGINHIQRMEHESGGTVGVRVSGGGDSVVERVGEFETDSDNGGLSCSATLMSCEELGATTIWLVLFP